MAQGEPLRPNRAAGCARPYAGSVARTNGESIGGARRIVPWVVSLGLHAGVIALGFLLTWTVVSLNDDEEPVVVRAELDALTYDPLVSLDARPQTLEEATPVSRVPAEPLDARLAELLAELDVSPVSLERELAPASGSISFTAAAGESPASFVGLTTSNARSVAYVIDASGSMIRSLPIVLDRLQRSLGTLSDEQTYAVIFFQRDEALMAPPNRLQPATAQATRRTLDWIAEHVIPAGGSNPVAALEKALGLRPDVIFLLSENVTGSGEFEIDQEDLLALLDRLNPIRRDGRRATRINCVQFLDPDPLDTLGRIAEQHGGRDGYKFLSRRELGLAAKEQE